MYDLPNKFPVQDIKLLERNFSFNEFFPKAVIYRIMLDGTAQYVTHRPHMYLAEILLNIYLFQHMVVLHRQKLQLYAL